MNLEDYCEKLYDYNEPIKEKNMSKMCRAVFTIVDDEDSKMNRTEVIEVKFPIIGDNNMFDAMIEHLSDEEEEKSSIITGH
jgi:hypothetical protein